MEINKYELTMRIRQTCVALVKALEAFDDLQFNTPPPQGGWTAGQVAEHLLLSAGVAEVIAGHTETSNRRPDGQIDVIAGIFLDFTTKLQSPDFIVPAPGYYEREVMVSRLKAVWTKLGEAVRLLDLTLTCTDWEFPGLGLLTRLEWINFYIFHTQRHLRQLNNLLAQTPARRRLPLPCR